MTTLENIKEEVKEYVSERWSYGASDDASRVADVLQAVADGIREAGDSL